MNNSVSYLKKLFVNDRLRGATLVTKPTAVAQKLLSHGSMEELLFTFGVDPIYKNCLNIYSGGGMTVYVIDTYNLLFMLTGGKTEVNIKDEDFAKNVNVFEYLLNKILFDFSDQIIEMVQFKFTLNETVRYFTNQLQFSDLVDLYGKRGKEFWSEAGFSKGIYSHLMQRDSILTPRNREKLHSLIPLIDLDKIDFSPSNRVNKDEAATA